MPVERDRLERQWEPLFSVSGTGGDGVMQGTLVHLHLVLGEF